MMLASLQKRWQPHWLAISFLIPSVLFSSMALAENNRSDYDLDDNGLIEINDLADLNEIRNNLDGKTLYGSNAGCPDAEDGTANGGCKGFELTTDLDFDTNQDGIMDEQDAYWNEGKGWLPIGEDWSFYFSATFDGNGHQIRNLFIDRPSRVDTGLLGYTKNAQIQNLALTGPLTSIKGDVSVGALIGYAKNNTSIERVMVTGSIRGNRFVGGLIGYAKNSEIRNSFASGSVMGSISVGGIAGSVQKSQIRNNLSTSWVKGDEDTGGVYGDGSFNTTQNTHWATDLSGQATSEYQSESDFYIGLTLTTLQCATQDNTTSDNSDCLSTDGSAEGLDSSTILYKDWDDAVWDFGTSEQLPGLKMNGKTYRDSDGDGALDEDDAWPNDPSVYLDGDNDGHPDKWVLSCDTECINASNLVLDQFPNNAAAALDTDLDGLPDAWISSCDTACQESSGLVLDTYLNDSDNDGQTNDVDSDDNNDGITDIDADSNGLVDIDSLEKLNAMRFQLDGIGLRLSDDTSLDQSGCPQVIHEGELVSRCHGYELTQDLDFDTNQNGIMDEHDAYWNEGQGWLPIGEDWSSYFSATFDGNGHQIRNLFINRPSVDNIGLFRYTKTAKVQNLVLTGPLMSIKGYRFVSALIGNAYTTSVERVMVTGSIRGNDNIGGLIGYAKNSEIRNSFASGSVKGENSIGGIAGSVRKSQIRNNLSTSWVKGNLFTGGVYGNGSGNTNQNTYWATDLSGQQYSYGTSENNFYIGLTLATLQCATQTNTSPENSDCLSTDGSAEGLDNATILFKDWDSSIWEFGTSEQLPGLSINGKTYRDSDGDGALDEDDLWPHDTAASVDSDGDGFPDQWVLSCNTECINASNLVLDQFPNNAAAAIDTDLDGLPDAWISSCDTACQESSGLVLDTYPNDSDNDGQTNDVDSDDNSDGITDIDANSNGLVDIDSLEKLNAMRFQLDGIGLRLSDDTSLDQSGCPQVIHEGELVSRCHGYELTQDLDFDTNQNGIMDEYDAYWNDGKGWRPIGGFTAMLDGNGHQIRNLFINRPSTSGIGLLGRTENAQIQNLVLTGPLMSIKGDYHVGALIGYAKNTSIRRTLVTGSIRGNDNIGGLIGDANNSEIRNSFISGSVEGEGGDFIGGLSGDFMDSQILNSLSTSWVKGRLYTGGVYGYGWGNTTQNTYWATDLSGQATSEDQSESDFYIGLTLATLQCATQANTSPNNSDCLSADGSAEGLDNPTVLFKDWDNAIWDFGTSEQLPGLSINGKTYRDSDGDGQLDRDDAKPLDTDNDGVANQHDAYPLISLNGRSDNDSDGIPDTCDTDCLALGLSEDLDDDNDGIADTNDGYPFISIGDLPDNDSDGIPDTCDTDCLALGLSEDLDDDNDGALDAYDEYPLISLNGRSDNDSDGIPDTCDTDCLATGLTEDLDDDNDGISDINDGYPFIAIGDLPDNDSDGIPDTCDADCLALGLSEDLDDDNDGVADIDDVYPLISLEGRSDNDSDGVPDTCDADCLALGMSEDLDDDNDGVADINDGHPFIAIGDLADNDKDGIPDTCDADCLALGLSEDLDDDNDGIADINDEYPLISLDGRSDNDSDGIPDTCDADCLILGLSEDLDDDNDGVIDTEDLFPFDGSEHSDFDGDGIGDVADNDDDNDGVVDAQDDELGVDNGQPSMTHVPDNMAVAVNSDSLTHYQLLADQAFFNGALASDMWDAELSYHAHLNGEPLEVNADGIAPIPSGENHIAWTAEDDAGNISEPMLQVIKVYPRARFSQAESIIGEASTAEIKVELTGDSPEYPVRVALAINNQSETDQTDFEANFSVDTQHIVTIEAGDDAEQPNRQGILYVPVRDDELAENEERLLLDLEGVILENESQENLYAIDADHAQHALTVTYRNLAPQVRLKLEQSGKEVANVQKDGGLVTITALVTDGNGQDEHTLSWDLNSLGLNAPIGRELSFDPLNLPIQNYEISVTATDNGINPLSHEQTLTFEVVEPPQEDDGGSGGGSLPLWFVLGLLGLLMSVRQRSFKR